MSKISFEVQGQLGAPSVDVELTTNDYHFGHHTHAAERLVFMHDVAREVERVISNRVRAMHQEYKRNVQAKQDADEREIARVIEITALEDRLADLKGVPMQDTAEVPA